MGFYINVYMFTSDWLSPSSSLQRLTLLHVNSNQCLDMPSEEDKMVPTLRDCNDSRSQQWLLRNMTLSVWSLALASAPLHHSHPNQSWLSTPSPGGSYHTHHTPLPVSAWPANAEILGSSSSSGGLSSITEVSPFTGLREAGPAMTSCGFGDLVMSRQGERCVWALFYGEHWNRSALQSASC